MTGAEAGIDKALVNGGPVVSWWPIIKALGVEGGGCVMTRLINDPRYWELRAEESRMLADLMTDAAAKRAMLEVAQRYEFLAGATKLGKIGSEPDKP